MLKAKTINHFGGEGQYWGLKSGSCIYYHLNHALKKKKNCKILKENIGKQFYDSGSVNNLEFIKIKNLCIKGRHQQSEKVIHRMGGNICKSYI
jgi:hypothetical protein